MHDVGRGFHCPSCCSKARLCADLERCREARRSMDDLVTTFYFQVLTIPPPPMPCLTYVVLIPHFFSFVSGTDNVEKVVSENLESPEENLNKLILNTQSKDAVETQSGDLTKYVDCVKNGCPIGDVNKVIEHTDSSNDIVDGGDQHLDCDNSTVDSSDNLDSRLCENQIDCDGGIKDKLSDDMLEEIAVPQSKT